MFQTPPVDSTGDYADDPAIWLHPTDAASSVIFGSDKMAGIYSYDLSGKKIQFVAAGAIDNIDVRYGLSLGGTSIDFVAGSNRTDDTISVYRIDPVTRTLEDISARKLEVGTEVYGYCSYHSLKTGKYFGIVTTKNGEMLQFELFDDGTGKIDMRQVRTLQVGDVGNQTEGCVADDEYGTLYVSEEPKGIWRLGAEPTDETPKALVDATGDSGHLTADAEGLTIYYASGGKGYLLASSQGNSTYNIYSRTPGNEFISSFTIVASDSIDGTQLTDGIDVLGFNLGSAFPYGIFVAHDGKNTTPGATSTNFKAVPWESIAGSAASPLLKDNTWDPRKPVAR